MSYLDLLLSKFILYTVTLKQIEQHIIYILDLMLLLPRRSFRFRHFKLGRGVPEILGVEVSDAPCRNRSDRQGVELRVAFHLEHLDRDGAWE